MKEKAIRKIWGRVFWAKDTASVKTLRWELAWMFQEQQKGMNVVGHKVREAKVCTVTNTGFNKNCVLLLSRRMLEVFL